MCKYTTTTTLLQDDWFGAERQTSESWIKISHSSTTNEIEMEAREKEGHPWRLYHNCPFGIFGGEIKIFSEKRTIVLMDALSLIAPITHIQGSAASISRPRTNAYDQLFLASSFQASRIVCPSICLLFLPKSSLIWLQARGIDQELCPVASVAKLHGSWVLDSDSFHAVSCSAAASPE